MIKVRSNGAYSYYVVDSAQHSDDSVLATSLKLSTPESDDLRFPAQAINPLGAASDPNVNTSTGLLEFSGTVDNVIAGVAQLPHGWADGTPITPHLHMVFNTAGTNNTRWKLEYNIGDINGTFQSPITEFVNSETITIANPNNNQKHAIAYFTPIAMTDRTYSCMILWRISRLANSDAADNYTGIVSLLEFDIHYLIDTLGENHV